MVKIRGKKRIRDLLERGVDEGVFPGAVLLCARGEEVAMAEAVGNLSIVPRYVPMKKDTIFDLASLTKPLATTLAVMKLFDSGKIDLDHHLDDLIEGPLPEDKRDISPRLLLNHSAGFSDWKPFFRDLVSHPPGERKQILRRWIMSEPLACEPGEKCLYSDLGFMVLEWIVEEATGIEMARFVEENIYQALRLERTFLASEDHLESLGRDEFAATEKCPWRNRVIQGEVHDENAYALGGYSGHAGLFGTAEEVHRIASMLRGHYLGRSQDHFKTETVKEFFRRQDMVAWSTWALGWDTPSLDGSSSGRYFSEKSVGHLGYTGTSLWMDLQKDAIVILLTNRVHPARDNEKIREFRPLLHDTVMEILGLDG
ncbi:MAG: serine hydrolase [Deltaproteobacteria bacterium]|nr:serine hydrolase [Deltaproteobacteria bacterium]